MQKLIKALLGVHDLLLLGWEYGVAYLRFRWQLVQEYKASYGDDSLGREMYQDKLKWWAQDNPQAFEEMLLKEAAARVEKRTGRFTIWL